MQELYEYGIPTYCTVRLIVEKRPEVPAQRQAYKKWSRPLLGLVLNLILRRSSHILSRVLYTVVRYKVLTQCTG